MPIAIIVAPHVERYTPRDEETIPMLCELDVGRGEILRCVREVQMDTQLKHCIL